MKNCRTLKADHVAVWAAIFLVALLEAYGVAWIAICLFEAVARELK